MCIVEAEHGYASSLPMPEDYVMKNVKSPTVGVVKKSQGTR